MKRSRQKAKHTAVPKNALKCHCPVASPQFSHSVCANNRYVPRRSSSRSSKGRKTLHGLLSSVQREQKAEDELQNVCWQMYLDSNSSTLVRDTLQMLRHTQFSIVQLYSSEQLGTSAKSGLKWKPTEKRRRIGDTAKSKQKKQKKKNIPSRQQTE